MDKIYEVMDAIAQNWLTVIAVVYIAGLMLYCHRKGFIHTALGICTAIVALLLTGMAGMALDKVLPSVVVDSPVALIAVKIICMIVIFILMRQVTRLILKASDAIMSLPVLHGLDQIAGAAAGLLFAVFFVWLVGVIITVCDGQEWTQPLLEQIDSSAILMWLHEHNVILTFLRGISLF